MLSNFVLGLGLGLSGLIVQYDKHTIRFSCYARTYVHAYVHVCTYLT